MTEFKRLTIILGHYGCGKTNLSLNIALDLASRGESVTIADMDVVNPYFRTGDYKELLQSRGIRVAAPIFVSTNLDNPSLPAAMDTIFSLEMTMSSATWAEMMQAPLRSAGTAQKSTL